MNPRLNRAKVSRCPAARRYNRQTTAGIRSLPAATGAGVLQDDVQAHMWFNLAASRSTGEDRESAVAIRNLAADELTPDALNEAQRFAREWNEAHPREAVTPVPAEPRLSTDCQHASCCTTSRYVRSTPVRLAQALVRMKAAAETLVDADDQPHLAAVR